jgi:large subunit ribosomal protein L22
MNRSYTATLRYATLSYQKMNLIAKMVRGKPVNEALGILEMMPKKAAQILWKVVKSAASNAENNVDANPDELVVATVNVGR